ncbi:chromate transporter [Candidatus Desulfobacillus denitrificans]|jgi:chromate transporter|uniref:Chromate transporter n=1 Tax=Candidatus Desulfobacillus denitrificans TaxID=2608985 RepID=A0A809RUN9_9PROT|nr:chromate transporter [Candidatus Desulfobacillus denitrificans]
MEPPNASDRAPAPVSSGEAFRYWLKLGFISFGGPAGQIAMMHQELVERRRWISERRFLHALNYCMLLAGLTWIYLAFGDVPAVAGILYGIKPAVAAIVVFAAWRIGSRALRNGILWAMAAAGLAWSLVVAG